MMRSLLHSRIDTGLTSNQTENDEDVNVYLAQLMHSFGDAEFLKQTAPFLHRCDTDVFSRIESSKDPYTKYRVYKTNADFLLISVGLFGNTGQYLLGQEPGTGKGRRSWDPSHLDTMGRGQSYYQLAHSYSLQVNRRHPAVSDVLAKLARGFDRYVQILTHLRSEYMHLIQELSRGEVYHLEQCIRDQQNQAALMDAHDVFLDAYAEWKRTGSDSNFQALEKAVESVRALDPGFDFNPLGDDRRRA